MANILTDPPFAADPPIKLNVPAKTLGLVIGILAIIGIIIDLIALPVVFALNNARAMQHPLPGGQRPELRQHRASSGSR